MPDGVIPIYVQFENMQGGNPSVQDLVGYANQNGIQDAPLLGDNNYAFFSHWEVDNYIPTLALVKYDGTILVKDGQITNQDIANAAPPYGGP